MADPAGYDAAVRLAHQWVSCDQRADSDCAVSLLHFPANDKGAALIQERTTMLRGVDVIRGRFGQVTGISQPTRNFLMLEVAWSTGDLDYWSKHPNSVKVTFPATFSKFGPGYLQAEACKIGPAWQLRAIHYGLPSSEPNTAARIGQTAAELYKLVRPAN